ncbi:HAL/PAL/TAL family ammonia-lyase [Actinokineospora inagensis]|uniref:HAL/PAL/TAL family ammonia-lyase n=1 Tax=Actinokineospora inagensis TaxID=103730 RepID=UPI000688703A|nr:aromatic amino acid ammonia-lyase [Actinokineospora inagensis]
MSHDVSGSALPGGGPRESVALDGHGLTLGEVFRCANNPGAFTYLLDDRTRVRMDRSVSALERLIATGSTVYGVTTGIGDSGDRRIATEKSEALQRNLVRLLRVGAGSCAPPEVVRATMLIRANSAARGYSAIRPGVVRTLLRLLEEDVLPDIPERGSVGASGDLAPLSYLAAALIGEGTVRHAGRETTAANAMRELGLPQARLRAKEALALVNGTSFMAAYAAVAHAEATELALVAELCTALATEVRRGPVEQFAAAAHAHKPHPGQRASARRVERLLAGSGLATGAGAESERHIQDPYSIRCAPHAIGVLRDTLSWTGDWLTIEINSCTDNPLIDPDTGTAHNSGHFYGGHVAHAAHAICSAAASVADLLDRQLQLVVDHKYSHGLPPNLVSPTDPAERGLHHGFKGAQVAASAFTAEALHLTMPAGSFSRSTESHNQDKVSMGTIAARHARAAVHLAIEVAAVHLLALAQAADLRGADSLAPGTRAVHDVVRLHIPFSDHDRPLDADIARAADLIRAGGMGGDVSPDRRSQGSGW